MERTCRDETALLAVQGPKAEALVGRWPSVDVPAIGYYRFASGTVAGVPALISRTGYTGEDGFELYCRPARRERLWNALIEAGPPTACQPIGLGARDTLRLEMRYALYGNDIDETTNPLEAGSAGSSSSPRATSSGATRSRRCGPRARRGSWSASR